MNSKLIYHAEGVRKACSEKIGSHYFSLENKVISNNDSKAMLQRMYEQECTDPKLFITVSSTISSDVLLPQQMPTFPTTNLLKKRQIRDKYFMRCATYL